ncbi:TetR/AcrR family transcriptional regulator [Starkeya sp. ORNL1]|uniref:TetR/AcrR family transcriptional regulator n=1 Tax=Starkeya sp. ORNL1 TaxID=2709380 RepID=UPI0014635A34|nr:TetR/AcrR family transcriptional regulator [Starkeya sp. ORNL1]QJP17018.1 TetR/AcrR family transcriptional regulator [Starkeya sp. ORNL1]
MRVSREKFAENRERILDAAAQLFRQKGYDGVGVADIMKAVGLTHGGFYGHFASKDDLIAQATCRASAGVLPSMQALARGLPDTALDAIADTYLSASHRDHPEAGCAFAALGSDMARQNDAGRAGVTAALRRQLDLLAPLMPGASAEERDRAAMAAFATLVGALMLARVSDDAKLSDELLEAGRAALARSKA